MTYIKVPKEIKSSHFKSKNFSFSAGLYRKVTIPNTNTRKVSELLDSEQPYDKGSEPGSMWYMEDSEFFFIRTKALQDFSCLPYPKGDSILGINKKVFFSPGLVPEDILLSKDSNVGECAILHDSDWSNHMFSGGVLRLNPIVDRYYLFSFLKHPIFKTQLLAKVPKGSTIKHAKDLWLDCLIPFPIQSNSTKIIKYISSIMKVIIDKEIAIRSRSEKINREITEELNLNQKLEKFIYKQPSFKEIIIAKRLDAATYSEEYKSKVWFIENYKNGFCTPKEEGFEVIPGPSLEIKIIGTRIDSDTQVDGFYTLILPMYLSEYGTLNKVSYLGTAKNLPLLQQGDILFGEAGFQKGRSIVFLDGLEKCTTNAHGLYARRKDGNIIKSIFFRCVFNWYRSNRLIDLMAVGGSGGHFSPEYFDYLRIPKFPTEKQNKISKYYHNAGNPPTWKISLDNYVDWHNEWNKELGVWELDQSLREQKGHLLGLQDKIINGDEVDIPF